MRLGILGGTFDPIHIGHILMAEEAAARLNLSEVIFIPAGRPRFKEDSRVTEAEHRLRMVKLAIGQKPSFRLSTMEIDRGGVTYTVDTVRELAGHLAPQDELFFIMGWDSLKELPLWRSPSELISLCRLVVVPRAGCPKPDLSQLETKIFGITKRLIMLDKPEIEVSSSEIRERVRLGFGIDGLVTETVAAYIAENGLYRQT
jgi:nicotinate-nucleotide adenylyltransferase